MEISAQCKKRERTTAKRSPSPLMSDPVISFTAAETCTTFFLLEGSRNAPWHEELPEHSFHSDTLFVFENPNQVVSTHQCKHRIIQSHPLTHLKKLLKTHFGEDRDAAE